MESLSSRIAGQVPDFRATDFIEPKGYVYVGYSRERMEMENMPAFEKILEFAGRMSELTGYEIAGENRPSRVVLLSKGRSPLTIDEI